MLMGLQPGLQEEGSLFLSLPLSSHSHSVFVGASWQKSAF